MRGWRFWQRGDAAAPPTPPVREASPVAPRARGFRPPPPRGAAFPAAADPAVEERLATLRRRREAIVTDVENAEAASMPDNPWRRRIALLDDAIQLVEAEIAAIARSNEEPGVDLPPTPITGMRTSTEPPIRIGFSIGNERFVFEEVLDWAERGNQLAPPEITRQSGDPAAIIPARVADDRRDELIAHLDRSMLVLATDLRDRTLNGRPLPASATLADLARPCEEGGWADWHGVCAARERRAWRKQELHDEMNRLAAERSSEEQERARIADRLPIARRRLAEIDEAISEAGRGANDGR